MANSFDSGGGDKVSKLHVLFPNVEARSTGAEHVERLMTEAAQGSREAAYHLGSMYRTGSGVERNAATAMEWYRKAAERGFARAQFSLALMLIAEGERPPDRDQALMWLTRVAAGDDPALASETGPYIVLLSLMIGSVRTGNAMRAAGEPLSSEE